MIDTDVSAMAEKIRAGDRRALAKAITRAESTRHQDRTVSNVLLDNLIPDTGKAMRIGISGTPGVGKSTFIEALGVSLCELEKRVAVLSVDPSSVVSGGSILGDKTRMPGLSSDHRAFIRPSPAGSTLGGVASRTQEAILFCEAAGFEVVLVETVGVGQSEVAVSNMTDLFILLLLPSGGDELQGIKRGVVELADYILINKADGDMVAAANKTVSDYRAALHLLRSNSRRQAAVEVQPVSAATNMGITECWQTIESRWSNLRDSGELDTKRQEQRMSWLHREISQSILQLVTNQCFGKEKLSELEGLVRKNSIHPASAAHRLVNSVNVVQKYD